MDDVSFRTLTNTRRFGVELEVSNTVPREFLEDVIGCCSSKDILCARYAQSVNNDYWHIKTDATCGILGKPFDKGWEISSYVGAGDSDVNHIAEVAGCLRRAGVEVNRNCGLHVHVEVQDFDEDQIGILLGHYIKFEWLLHNMVPEDRWDNPYCKPLFREFKSKSGRWWAALKAGNTLHPLKDGEKIPAKMLWHFFLPRSCEAIDNPYRYRSVNLVNFAASLTDKFWKRKTVEFRLPNCSLVPSNVANWTRLFVNFVDWVKCQKDTPNNLDPIGLRESLYHMGLGHGQIFYILDRPLFDMKTWALRRYLHYGAWAEEAKEILNEMWMPVRNFS
jgi:hypothetical protein